MISQARGDACVVPNKIPVAMSSRVLDYKRPSKKAIPGEQPRQDALCQETRVEAEAEAPVRTNPPPHAKQVPTFKGPLDYPTINNWLKNCEEDFERGRDKHEYTKLTPVFVQNGCTRIDDIARLSTDVIKALAQEQGLSISLGLVYRVYDYATADVLCIKTHGRL